MVTLRTLVAIPRDLLDAIDAARMVEGERAQEPVSRSAMIRRLLRQAIEQRTRETPA